jgi:hypothetical protein
MYGIEKTHMQQMRKRQGLRLMAEERLVEIGQALQACGNGLANLYDVGDFAVKKVINFGLENKKYAVVGLVAAVVIFIMVY